MIKIKSEKSECYQINGEKEKPQTIDSFSQVEISFMLSLYVFHIRYISIYKTHGKCVSGNSQTTKCTSQWIFMNYMDLKEKKVKYINLAFLEQNLKIHVSHF